MAGSLLGQARGGALAVLLVGGCGGAPATTPPATVAPPTVAPTAAAPSPLATVAATAGASMVAHNVSYQVTDAVLEPDRLDVYAPASGGPWPVVVMFHGQPNATPKEFLAEHAQRVAAAGYVVFNVSWGHTPPLSQADPYAYAAAAGAQAACAFAFAAGHAKDYGGDARTLVAFGHSGGANIASVAAFGPRAPSAGCASQGEPVAADALVTMDGNWLLDPGFDATLEADPRIFDLMTPWSLLGGRPRLPVVMLRAETPGPDLEAPMPSQAVGPFLALRDHRGLLAPLVERLHPYDDGLISMTDMQPVFLEALRDNGNPVTFTIVPGTTHTNFAKADWPVFLAAFDQALAAVGA